MTSWRLTEIAHAALVRAIARSNTSRVLLAQPDREVCE